MRCMKTRSTSISIPTIRTSSTTTTTKPARSRSSARTSRTWSSRRSPPPMPTAGESITVTWSVENLGEKARAAFGTTACGFSSTEDLNGARQPTLAARHGSPQRRAHAGPGLYRDADLPASRPSMQGAYVIVRTDQFGAETGQRLVREGPYRQKPMRPTTIARMPRWSPAQRVTCRSLVRHPRRAQRIPAKPPRITWSVTNSRRRSVGWHAALWYDAIWISKDPTFNPQRAVRLGVKAHSNTTPLAANGSYTEFMDVNVPPGYDGHVLRLCHRGLGELLTTH